MIREYQLRYNPSMALSPRLPPGQLPHVDRCGKRLAQSHCFCLYLPSKFSITTKQVKGISHNSTSESLPVIEKIFISLKQAMAFPVEHSGWFSWISKLVIYLPLESRWFGLFLQTQIKSLICWNLHFNC